MQKKYVKRLYIYRIQRNESQNNKYKELISIHQFI